MKNQLAAIDLRQVINELQCLSSAKIEKVFQQEKPVAEFLFQLHVPTKGKQFLYVHLPGMLCLADFKPSFPALPPHFAASLRRKITNARIQSIEQIDFERIVKLTLTTAKGLSYLYIELFSPGNIVLCDEEGKILSAYHMKKWQGRDVLPGRIYELPPKQINPLALSKEEFAQTLRSSSQSSLVKALAVDTSFGGAFSEEILALASVDKNMPVSELSEQQAYSLFSLVHEFIAKPIQPYLRNQDIFPYPVTHGQALDVSSFNEALTTALLSKRKIEEKKQHEVAQKKSTSKFDSILSAQEAQKNHLEEAIEKNQEKGDTIYAHYSVLSKLHYSIQQDFKSLSPQEFQEKYTEHPVVSSVDYKNRTVTLEVDNV